MNHNFLLIPAFFNIHLFRTKYFSNQKKFQRTKTSPLLQTLIFYLSNFYYCVFPVASYFTCSDLLKPFLFKYLETAAYDKRRAYHGTALVCLHNLRNLYTVFLFIKKHYNANLDSVELFFCDFGDQV